MERSELVMDIVFSNEQTFKGLSVNEWCVIRTTSKDVEKNQNIINAALRFRVCNTYNEVYSKIVNSCYTLNKAYSEKQRAEAQAMFEEANNLVKQIAEICNSDSDFRDCLYRLIMAEYKENLYDMLFDTNIQHMDRFIYAMARSSFIKNLALGNPKKYIHDPEHFMFERYTYKFHDFEKTNGSIIAAKRIEEREKHVDRIRGKRWYDENHEDQYYAEYVDSDDEYSDYEDNI